MTLGYTQSSWDKNAEHPKWWRELTSTEKAAARVLGYTSKSWDDGDEHSKFWSALTTCDGEYECQVICLIQL